MLQTITLKCPNCGANLNIAPEMSSFACGYCGAAQIVERQGGTIALKLVTDAIHKVQQGTDRTAAELALRRLRDDLAAVEQHYAAIGRTKAAKEYALKQNLKPLWIVPSVICFLMMVLGTMLVKVLGAIILISAIVVVIYFYNQKHKIIEADYEENSQHLFRRGNEIQRQIDIHTKTVSQI